MLLSITGRRQEQSLGLAAQLLLIVGLTTMMLSAGVYLALGDSPDQSMIFSEPDPSGSVEFVSQEDGELVVAVKELHNVGSVQILTDTGDVAETVGGQTAIWTEPERLLGERVRVLVDESENTETTYSVVAVSPTGEKTTVIGRYTVVR